MFGLMIRINNRFGIEIGNIELFLDECDNWRTVDKTNTIKKIYSDMVQTEKQGFIECLDIDLEVE